MEYYLQGIDLYDGATVLATIFSTILTGPTVAAEPKTARQVEGRGRQRLWVGEKKKRKSNKNSMEEIYSTATCRLWLHYAKSLLLSIIPTYQV